MHVLFLSLFNYIFLLFSSCGLFKFNSFENFIFLYLETSICILFVVLTRSNNLFRVRSTLVSNLLSTQRAFKILIRVVLDSYFKLFYLLRKIYMFFYFCQSSKLSFAFAQFSISFLFLRFFFEIGTISIFVFLKLHKINISSFSNVY